MRVSSQDDNSGQLALKALHPIVHQNVKVAPESYVCEVACSCFKSKPHVGAVALGGFAKGKDWKEGGCWTESNQTMKLIT